MYCHLFMVHSVNGESGYTGTGLLVLGFKVAFISAVTLLKCVL